MSENGSLASIDLPGRIYTFYSYKGGVGRSMALVNVGALMALEGHRVLLVDWDLEAPGLEVFFERAPTTELVGRPEHTPGIVDLLEAQANKTTVSWRDCLLRARFKDTSLDFISSGRRSVDYRSRLQKLNWADLFEHCDIGNYLDQLREDWRQSYDFILIDSRTGITDIGDICTVIMPDAIVTMFVANNQNIEGVKVSIERARTARQKLPVNRNKLMVVPLQGRDESKTEYEISIRWRGIFEREFSFLLREWLPKEISPAEAITKLFIPYVPIWSFGERIPVLESQRELQDPRA